MNVFAVFIAIIAIVYLINKIYRTPGKVVFTENDNAHTSVLANANTEAISRLGLDVREQLVLQETAVAGEVLVKAKGNGTGYETIGQLHDIELYKKVQQKRARAKITAVAGTDVTVVYSYS
ncbi:hypothetical protein [Flavobacterium psychrotrophum]|uniref:hypothetical protein n=1 Tax=Flavobacterium psychrotrophum TaxID=2294119 RepID=UPI000E324F8B|nr:hypothetical protein [Flavobacterium psychrotrophum]